MSEKFALKWNDYQSNWNKSLSQLRKDTDLADVTLISDDKVKFSAHKVILSSCSNMFKFILKENTNASPLLYLGGVSSVNLGYILDYIYHGEVNIFQEQLDSFLETAQKLEIDGLIGQEVKGEPDEETYNKNTNCHKDEIVPLEAKTSVKVNNNQKVITRRQYEWSSNDESKIDVSSFTLEEIEEKLKELYQKVDGLWTCMACDYTSKQKHHLKMHVEKHMDGLSYSCNLCNKEFRTNNSLTVHIATSHQGISK